MQKSPTLGLGDAAMKKTQLSLKKLTFQQETENQPNKQITHHVAGRAGKKMREK